MNETEHILYEEFYEMFEIVHKTESIIFSMPLHMHNAVEIYLNLTDVPQILLGTKLIPFHKNTLLVIPAYCAHKVIAPKGLVYERYILTIHTKWLENIFGKNFEKYCAFFMDTENPRIFHLTEEEKDKFVESFSNLTQCADLNIFEKLQIFFSILAKIQKMTKHNNGKLAEDTNMQIQGPAGLVSAMMNYINAHLCENITVEEIADSLYLNHDYASRIFKKYTNISVKQFVMLQRITKAKQLLLEGNSVSETQNMLGFNSYEHFFKTFKKVTGMTPKAYIACYTNGRKNDR